MKRKYKSLIVDITVGIITGLLITGFCGHIMDNIENFDIQKQNNSFSQLSQIASTLEEWKKEDIK